MLIGEWALEEEGGNSDQANAPKTGQPADTNAGTSGDTDDPAPLAQHPTTLLMGPREGRNNPSNEPFG